MPARITDKTGVPGLRPRAMCAAGAVWLILLALTLPAVGAKEPEPVPRGPGELQLVGKLYCSLKRAVVLPFAGEITALSVAPGQAVQAGEVLGRYRLTPEAVQALRRRLAPPGLHELEARLAQVDKDLAAAQARWRSAQALAREQLASRQGVAEAERAVQALKRSRGALAQRLGEERRLAQEERQLLARQLGVALPAGSMPHFGVLTAPIAGHVLWLHPDLRPGAELKGGEPVVQIGVLDPMILLSRVHERDFPHLTPGVEVQAAVDSLPGRTFPARLSRLPWSSPTPVEQPSYFEAEFVIPNPDLILKEGLKATVTVKRPRAGAHGGRAAAKDPEASSRCCPGEAP